MSARLRREGAETLTPCNSSRALLCRRAAARAGHQVSEQLLQKIRRSPTGSEFTMMKLMSRHVDMTEAKRLGVTSGWYGTKVSGTFVAGPFPTEEGCLKKIAEVGAISQDRPI